MRRDPAKPVYVGRAWHVVLRDLGLNESAVLQRAGLPAGLFGGDGSWVSLDDYYALGEATEAEAGDAAVAVRAGAIVSIELFDPAYFAAICSPDLHTALCRLSAYMRLVGPFALDVEDGNGTVQVRFRCKVRPDVARPIGLSQLAFLVALGRRATRHHIVPRRVTADGPTDGLDTSSDFFGCRIESADRWSVEFDALDGRRPFLTRNDELWETYEPALRRNMTEADVHRPVSHEVEELLIEFLPSGRTAMSDVAGELGIGRRTLQRRLASEGTSWLEVLSGTRERLARYYFESTDLNATEVGFLLGFEDPGSLFRAFHRWTGTTPEIWRAEVRGDNVGSGESG
jgi:AraC-like DNA-binding protein